jgi:hypothetical protein
MKYKIHEMLVAYCIIISFPCGCICKRGDVIAVHIILCNKTITSMQSLIELNIIEIHVTGVKIRALYCLLWM